MLMREIKSRVLKSTKWNTTLKLPNNPASTATKLIMVAAMTSGLFACGGGTSTAGIDPLATTTNTPTPAATTTPAVTSPGAEALRVAGLNGKSLWSANCASCHGSDLGRGANPSKIMSAIASNKGGMGFLSGVITADNASNIATYVSNPAVN
jgi:Cytochrome C oxidase, cbb3-type, subunit III